MHISWEGAQYLLEHLLPVNNPIDIEIVDYFRKFDPKGCYSFNGDVVIDGIRPNDHKELNGDRCMFNGIIYQNKDQGSTIHNENTVY